MGVKVKVDSGNVVVCRTCRARLISEEQTNHVCDEGYRIEGNDLWIRSRWGEWKKRSISDETLHGHDRRGLDRTIFRELVT